MARKRANGEGSYYQLPDRTWVYQVTIGRKEDGAPKRKSFKPHQGHLQRALGDVGGRTGRVGEAGGAGAV